MTLIIAGFFTQNLSAKAVELMSNGFLLGWCQLQESFTSSHAPRGRLSSPFASIPNGRCGFGKVSAIFLKFFKNIFSLGDSGGFSAPEEFFSMLERCPWVYDILPFPPFLKNWKPNFRNGGGPRQREKQSLTRQKGKNAQPRCVFLPFLIPVAALTAKKTPMPLCLM